MLLNEFFTYICYHGQQQTFIILQYSMMRKSEIVAEKMQLSLCYTGIDNDAARRIISIIFCNAPCDMLRMKVAYIYKMYSVQLERYIGIVLINCGRAGFL